MKKSLDILDSFFLKDRKFIAGNDGLYLQTLSITLSLFAGDEISIADILCLSEITQYWLADTDLQERGSNIKRWVEDCRQVLNPHFDKVNKELYEIRKAGIYKATFDFDNLI